MCLKDAEANGICSRGNKRGGNVEAYLVYGKKIYMLSWKSSEHSYLWCRNVYTHTHAVLQGVVRNGVSSDKIFTVNSPFPSNAMQWKLFPRIRVHR